MNFSVLSIHAQTEKTITFTEKELAEGEQARLPFDDTKGLTFSGVEVVTIPDKDPTLLPVGLRVESKNSDGEVVAENFVRFAMPEDKERDNFSPKNLYLRYRLKQSLIDSTYSFPGVTIQFYNLIGLNGCLTSGYDRIVNGYRSNPNCLGTAIDMYKDPIGLFSFLAFNWASGIANTSALHLKEKIEKSQQHPLFVAAESKIISTIMSPFALAAGMATSHVIDHTLRNENLRACVAGMRQNISPPADAEDEIPQWVEQCEVFYRYWFNNRQLQEFGSDFAGLFAASFTSHQILNLIKMALAKHGGEKGVLIVKKLDYRFQFANEAVRIVPRLFQTTVRVLSTPATWVSTELFLKLSDTVATPYIVEPLKKEIALNFVNKEYSKVQDRLKDVTLALEKKQKPTRLRNESCDTRGSEVSLRCMWNHWWQDGDLADLLVDYKESQKAYRGHLLQHATAATTNWLTYTNKVLSVYQHAHGMYSDFVRAKSETDIQPQLINRYFFHDKLLVALQVYKLLEENLKEDASGEASMRPKTKGQSRLRKKWPPVRAELDVVQQAVFDIYTKYFDVTKERNSRLRMEKINQGIAAIDEAIEKYRSDSDGVAPHPLVSVLAYAKLMFSQTSGTLTVIDKWVKQHIKKEHFDFFPTEFRQHDNLKPGNFLFLSMLCGPKIESQNAEKYKKFATSPLFKRLPQLPLEFTPPSIVDRQNLYFEDICDQKFPDPTTVYNRTFKVIKQTPGQKDTTTNYVGIQTLIAQNLLPELTGFVGNTLQLRFDLWWDKYASQAITGFMDDKQIEFQRLIKDKFIPVFATISNYSTRDLPYSVKAEAITYIDVIKRLGKYKTTPVILKVEDEAQLKNRFDGILSKLAELGKHYNLYRPTVENGEIRTSLITASTKFFNEIKALNILLKSIADEFGVELNEKQHFANSQATEFDRAIEASLIQLAALGAELRRYGDLVLLMTAEGFKAEPLKQSEAFK